MDRQRFGDVALQLGLLNSEQVERAVLLQQDEDAAGTPRRPLGLICMELGYLTFDQVMAVLARQQHAVALS